ncbi:MAG: hypothetical protein JJU06_22085 [Ectothiorhodospiraceae bacterium]|nr:hypothetical protein [Ectothiorhodospiraceae bacterium]MCH8504123.1 hypothetical protein [Ectothiorhodospiraceae bacterium]
MAELIVQYTSTAQWHGLLMDAQERSRRHLSEDSESYLVFLLMRYLRRPDLVRRVMAMGYLKAMLSAGRLRQERLQDVGDQCLILAGLFPGQAARRRVALQYFVDLGRGAFHWRAQSDDTPEESLYGDLARRYPDLIAVLQALRTLDARVDGALEAEEAVAEQRLLQ